MVQDLSRVLDVAQISPLQLPRDPDQIFVTFQGKVFSKAALVLDENDSDLDRP